jgi:hypothetical protein
VPTKYLECWMTLFKIWNVKWTLFWYLSQYILKVLPSHLGTIVDESMRVMFFIQGQSHNHMVDVQTRCQHCSIWKHLYSFRIREESHVVSFQGPMLEKHISNNTSPFSIAWWKPLIWQTNIWSILILVYHQRSSHIWYSMCAHPLACANVIMIFTNHPYGGVFSTSLPWNTNFMCANPLLDCVRWAMIIQWWLGLWGMKWHWKSPY